MSRPILLNSCARAATAAEARFRIDRPIAPSRGTRVVALDPGAEAVVREVAGRPWASARFFTCPPEAVLGRRNGDLADVLLLRTDGAESRLSSELDGADAAVMVATSDDGAEAARAIGDACTVRAIMTAGLVLAGGHTAGATVSALRPHARVLLVTYDDNDVSEILTALRA